MANLKDHLHVIKEIFVTAMAALALWPIYLYVEETEAREDARKAELVNAWANCLAISDKSKRDDNSNFVSVVGVYCTDLFAKLAREADEADAVRLSGNNE